MGDFDQRVGNTISILQQAREGALEADIPIRIRLKRQAMYLGALCSVPALEGEELTFVYVGFLPLKEDAGVVFAVDEVSGCLEVSQIVDASTDSNGARLVDPTILEYSVQHILRCFLKRVYTVNINIHEFSFFDKMSGLLSWGGGWHREFRDPGVFGDLRLPYVPARALSDFLDVVENEEKYIQDAFWGCLDNACRGENWIQTVVKNYQFTQWLIPNCDNFWIITKMYQVVHSGLVSAKSIYQQPCTKLDEVQNRLLNTSVKARTVNTDNARPFYGMEFITNPIERSPEPVRGPVTFNLPLLKDTTFFDGSVTHKSTADQKKSYRNEANTKLLLFMFLLSIVMKWNQWKPFPKRKKCLIVTGKLIGNDLRQKITITVKKPLVMNMPAVHIHLDNKTESPTHHNIRKLNNSSYAAKSTHEAENITPKPEKLGQMQGMPKTEIPKNVADQERTPPSQQTARNQTY